METVRTVCLKELTSTRGETIINAEKQIPIAQKLLKNVFVLNQELPIFPMSVITLNARTAMKNFTSSDLNIGKQLVSPITIKVAIISTNRPRSVPENKIYGVKHGEIANKTDASFIDFLIFYLIFSVSHLNTYILSHSSISNIHIICQLYMKELLLG